MRRFSIITALVILAVLGLWSWFWPPALWSFVIAGPLALVLIYDLVQKKHTILRIYPVVGHLRYVLEDFRRHVRQYFIQGDDEGIPFIRVDRSLVYQRAKRETDTQPFGTIEDVYRVGHEWLNHSLAAKDLSNKEPRVTVGGHQCDHPYLASRMNISAMSFGSLSSHAIEALNKGARDGNFYHNTGEGGVSRYHLKHGGDLVWEIGTAYFGCRSEDGHFDPDQFRKTACGDTVKMVEIKLSQGAKPGGGGVLPGAKVTKEIADARGVPVGKDVHSPPGFDEFNTPIGLLEFVQRLRELCGGKPVGFKLCIGRPKEFLAVIKAMHESKILPDFITIDGAEGGTGAAPLELADSVGTPLREGLVFAHNALVGGGLREEIRLIASGKVITGFDIAAKLAMGADLCNVARGFMFSLGCIQARVCNLNICPTGITTTKPDRVQGLVVEDKAKRVTAYHHQTISNFLKVLGACGVDDPSQLDPEMLLRRTSPTEVKSYRELYHYLEPGQLLEAPDTTPYGALWKAASTSSFQ